MFYFQQLLNEGLAGIDHTSMIPSIIGIAYTILLIGFLIGLYQAAIRGGDLQSLAVTAIKYLVVAVILANWSMIFHEVNGSFNQVAQFIDGASGAGDMFLTWMDQLKQQFSNEGFTTILPAISGTMAAITTALMILGAYLIYAMAVVVFAFFYVLYGCVLYVGGPLVLALLPMGGVGQLAKSYATNLMIWNAWGIVYATFASLITAIHFDRIDQIVGQGFLSGFFQGASDSVVLGLVSVFYALALLLIPFIAKGLISGDVGSSAYSFLRAGSAAAAALISGGSGFAAGVGVSGQATTVAATQAIGGAIPLGVAPAPPPPAQTLAEAIRSGIRSAVEDSAPSAPSAATAGQEAFSSTSAQRSVSGTNISTTRLRPIGVSQTVAFHAGKFAGSLIGNSERSAAAGGNA